MVVRCAVRVGRQRGSRPWLIPKQRRVFSVKKSTTPPKSNVTLKPKTQKHKTEFEKERERLDKELLEQAQKHSILPWLGGGIFSAVILEAQLAADYENSAGWSKWHWYCTAAVSLAGARFTQGIAWKRGHKMACRFINMCLDEAVTGGIKYGAMVTLRGLLIIPYYAALMWGLSREFMGTTEEFSLKNFIRLFTQPGPVFMF